MVTPLGAQRDHQVLNPAQPTLAFTHDLGFEAGLAIPGHLEVDRSDLGEHGFGPMPITGVTAVAAGWIIGGVAEMVAHLTLQGVLQHQLGQLL